jgi:hypothetical protein
VVAARPHVINSTLTLTWIPAASTALEHRTSDAGRRATAAANGGDGQNGRGLFSSATRPNTA